MGLTAADIEDLRRARALLENPGLAARISDVVGSPIERGFGMLPKSWNAAVMNATRKAIEAALDVALRTLDPERAETTSNRWHKLAVGTTGAAGGAFGLAALAIELPLSTTIMLRSIAEIARSEGEDLGSAEARLQCVQVLALGGKSGHDDAAETGYFAARAAMAKAVSEAARYATQQGAIARGAPAIVQLITQVASRFSITVSQKVAAQAVPVVGAVGGALINTLFIDHFQDMARGHFTVRRLERVHGADEVRLVYKEL
ncbi:EcsC family protein [Aromatoleum bremense]|uniref:EcsC family protein n=1 Tax=Aromatoleum bremense TaxID=76115 RepID=A0ABX1NVS3_9RHOO|nr:EcsC family protein [Aromatoleum bremense]NMG15873.1 EcsC family protein [Aromatoleum bremense]QTQ32081.1 EcsC family protein [Aromatoleum bremense]